LIWLSKNQEFDVYFESVEKVGKKVPAKKVVSMKV
jgi:hypothetical protein